MNISSSSSSSSSSNSSSSRSPKRVHKHGRHSYKCSLQKPPRVTISHKPLSKRRLGYILSASLVCQMFPKISLSITQSREQSPTHISFGIRPTSSQFQTWCHSFCPSSPSVFSSPSSSSITRYIMDAPDSSTNTAVFWRSPRQLKRFWSTVISSCPYTPLNGGRGRGEREMQSRRINGWGQDWLWHDHFAFRAILG